MTIRTFIAANAKFGLFGAALLLSACGTQYTHYKERRADEAYQQAVAANDLIGQRNALLLLTNADEDVSDYWIRLAKVELELGSYAGAYQHFSRAHELDRTDVPSLSMMTELAVINGRLDLADTHLKELLVLAPNDRAVAVARGFEALRSGNFDQAESNAQILLSQSANDSIGNVLQTRILVTQKKIPEAISLLEQKLAATPDDRAMLRSLAAVYRYLGEWPKAVPLALKLWKLSPRDPKTAAQAISDSLHAGDHPAALEITRRVLADAKDKDELDNVLSAWAKLTPGDGSLAAAIPANASDMTRIAFAHYLNQVGRPNQALNVLGRKSRPLGVRANVPFNAAFAEALEVRGQLQPARQMLDRILVKEGDNEVALGARARLQSAMGDHRRATIDAQRLVANYSTNPDYRLLLAKVYRASHDGRSAERTLWDGFRDLPVAESLYNEVRHILLARGDAEGVSRLDSGYQDDRFAQLLKELA